MPEKLDNERLRFFLESWPHRLLEYLYEYYRPILIRRSEYRTHDRKASEDIVQEAILEIWKQREWILSQKELNVVTFLNTIIENKSISFYNRKNLMTLAHEKIASYDSRNFLEPSVFDISFEERDLLLWKIIQDFPRREVQCLRMKYKNDMSNIEIAAQLGIGVKTVEATMTRAYKRLRANKNLLIW